MSIGGLTSSAGLKLGPVILETLVKHYYRRIKTANKIAATTSSDGVVHDGNQVGSTLNDNLRQEELLYDEVFSIAKDFMKTASQNTVEELQRFMSTKIPSLPSVKVLRVLVPMSCCDEAAKYLIDVLGGESATKEIVGGTKWWQIRGVEGIDGEWIVAKKDLQEAEKRAKSKEHRGRSSQQSAASDSAPVEDTSKPDYTPDMDEQRCILFLHGGGYYFGSVDQERYSIQRFARKINGRAFAINYRLSPQYPFPCAIQDCLAAYLYLIRPPPEAKHKAVKPEHIVIMGDSAGGGLALAILQIIRDSGLPSCSGGVLISPWCDLSHSFPSIHTNTATDVMPFYGLSMHKPSVLWPPPTDLESDAVRQRIRSRLRRVSEDQDRLKSFLCSRGRAPHPKDGTITPEHVADAGRRMDFGASTSLPSVVKGQDQMITLELDGGETLEVDSQIQLYAPNNLVSHPLIGHCGAYLGGLPPLFFMAGDHEVLRDEIIYTAHRAADPSRFPVPAAARKLYPRMEGIEARHPTPTKVHLQVYDGCAHILPILFAFTTPAKYCFRAIASFCRFATGMQPSPRSTSLTAARRSTSSQPENIFAGTFFIGPLGDVGDSFIGREGRGRWGVEEDKDSPMSKNASKTGGADKIEAKSEESREGVRAETAEKTEDDIASSLGDAKPIRSLNSRKSTNKSQRNTKQDTRRWSLNKRGSNPEHISMPSKEPTEDVAGPRFEAVEESEGERCAGDYPPIYVDGFVETNFIRERVSIRGVIRPLEAEAELPAFQLEPELIGVVSKDSLSRYIQGKADYKVKFSDTLKKVADERKRHLDLAFQEGDESLVHLEYHLHTIAEESESGQSVPDSTRSQKVAAEGWKWCWALDDDEHPPPSSIVSRRDTREARRLAMIADTMPGDANGNNLWQDMVSFLTITPDKKVKLPTEREHPKPKVGGQRGSGWVEVSAPSEIDNRVKDAAKDTPAQAKSTALSPTLFNLKSGDARLRDRRRP